MPIGIAEVGIPGLQAAPVPSDIPASCRSDLLSVDGAPLWVEVTGSTTTALDRQPLTVSLCGPDAGGVALGPGDHTLQSTPGQVTGFDIDQLALDSAPGGGAMPLASPDLAGAPAGVALAGGPRGQPDRRPPSTSRYSGSMPAVARPRSTWSSARASTPDGRPRSTAAAPSVHRC